MALRLIDEAVLFPATHRQAVLSNELAAESDSELARSSFSAEILKLGDYPNPKKYRNYLMGLEAWRLKALLDDLKRGI